MSHETRIAAVHFINECIAQMEAVIPFFPSTNLGRYRVGLWLAEETDGDVKKIEWVTEQAILRLSQWRGIPCLRDILDTYRAPEEGPQSGTSEP